MMDQSKMVFFIDLRENHKHVQAIRGKPITLSEDKIFKNHIFRNGRQDQQHHG